MIEKGGSHAVHHENPEEVVSAITKFANEVFEKVCSHSPYCPSLVSRF